MTNGKKFKQQALLKLKKNQDTGNNKNDQNEMGEDKFHYHVRNSNSKLWEIEEKIGNSR